MRTLMTMAALLPASALAAPACDVPAGWTKATPHRAADTPEMRFALKMGEGAKLTLLPATRVKLAAPSSHASKSGSFAGLAAVDIARSGTVRIALSGRAYVDLVGEGKALVSIAHAMIGCGGIAKTVSFAVTPGRYVVQITDAPSAALTMIVSVG